MICLPCYCVGKGINGVEFQSYNALFKKRKNYFEFNFSIMQIVFISILETFSVIIFLFFFPQTLCLVPYFRITL